MAKTLREIYTVCPYCEEDIVIGEREIKLAVRHGSKTGRALVACENCCRTLQLPENVPEGEADLAEWFVDLHRESDDWLDCIGLLNQEVEKEPLGFEMISQVVYYKSGGGAKGLRRREYMEAFGFDPYCFLHKQGRI